MNYFRGIIIYRYPYKYIYFNINVSNTYLYLYKLIKTILECVVLNTTAAGLNNMVKTKVLIEPFLSTFKQIIYHNR